MCPGNWHLVAVHHIAKVCASNLIMRVWLQAVRKNRYVVLPKDIEKGYKNIVKRSDTEFAFYK